jgi:hypothetical protein
VLDQTRFGYVLARPCLAWPQQLLALYTIKSNLLALLSRTTS